LLSITPATSTLAELGFRCRLRLDNPNDVALPVKGGELRLTVAGQAAARGQLADDVTIPALASTEVDSVVHIDVLSAVTVIGGLLDRPDALVPYAVEGFVDVGITRLGRIRFDERGEFSLAGAGNLIRTRL
jgi:LEA14-like dessication related protein